MFSSVCSINSLFISVAKFVCVFFLGATFILLTSFNAKAQPTYNSGSTGVDGALDLSVDRLGCPAAQTTCTLQLPPSGVFNFTTVNIPIGKTLKFTKNATNTPVFILAQGEVRIFGTIDIRGDDNNVNIIPEFGFPSIGGRGGPGGFDGGAAGTRYAPLTNGVAGNGPGGGGAGTNSVSPTNSSSGGGGGGFVVSGANGTASGPSATGSQGGLIYGNKNLVPLIGGSGGGGGSSYGQGLSIGRGGGGGGGGGAILIASSTVIRFRDDGGGSGSINAHGGNANNTGQCGPGGGGAGGAIRLASAQITGSLDLDVRAGVSFTGGCFSGSTSGGAGSNGRLRIEAYNYSNVNFNNFNGVSGEHVSVTQIPLTAIPTGLPSVKITSVAGQNIPDPPSGSPHGVVDLFLPNATPNPATVAISATNVPTGTIVKVTTQPNAGTRTTVDSTPLAGTTAASTGTASINIPEGVSLITATVTFFAQTLAGNKPLIISGEKVEKIEVSSTLGGGSEVIYITKSGKRIKESEVNKEKR